MNNKLSNNQISSIKDFYIQKIENDKIKKKKFIINQKLNIFFKKKFDKINSFKNNNLGKIVGIQENNGLKLAVFLENKGFPTYTKGPSCGANVGNAMIDFGIQGLPKSGRDGYKWIYILDNNKNFIKKSISNPSEALPGGILVYDKGFSTNMDRKTYGHVEIKTKEGYWYGGKQKFKAGGNIIAGFSGYVYYPKVV